MSKLLKTGEIAKGIEKKYEENKAMTEKKLNWLRVQTGSIEGLPSDFDKFTLGFFCAYESSKFGLKRLSLNTYKAHLIRIYGTNHNKVLETKKLINLLKDKDKASKGLKAQPRSKNWKKEAKEIKARYHNLIDTLLSLRVSYLRPLLSR
jgi:hypothetical protein